MSSANHNIRRKSNEPIIHRGKYMHAVDAKRGKILVIKSQKVLLPAEWSRLWREVFKMSNRAFLLATQDVWLTNE